MVAGFDPRDLEQKGLLRQAAGVTTPPQLQCGTRANQAQAQSPLEGGRDLQPKEKSQETGHLD